jgi:hypothetical protein
MKNFSNILNKSYQTLSSSPMSWNTRCDLFVVDFNHTTIDPKQHLKNTREVLM